MAEAGAPATVKSAMRTLDILEYVVAEARPVPAHEIATALAIPVSSLSYLLGTLAERGYLDRAGRRYLPGPALGRLASRPEARTLAERAAPLIRSIRVQLNETAALFALRGFELEAVVSEIGGHALRYTVEVGQRRPLHAFSAGKAVLASLPPAELDRYFATTERERFTARTLVGEVELRAELETIRRTGFARTQEEHTPGICGLGRAVTVEGAVVGALSIAVPLVRYDEEVERKAADLLRRAAELLATPGGEG